MPKGAASFKIVNDVVMSRRRKASLRVEISGVNLLVEAVGRLRAPGVQQGRKKVLVVLNPVFSLWVKKDNGKGGMVVEAPVLLTETKSCKRKTRRSGRGGMSAASRRALETKTDEAKSERVRQERNAIAKARRRSRGRKDRIARRKRLLRRKSLPEQLITDESIWGDYKFYPGDFSRRLDALEKEHRKRMEDRARMREIERQSEIDTARAASKRPASCQCSLPRFDAKGWCRRCNRPKSPI